MRRPGMQAYRAYKKPLLEMFKSKLGDDSKLLLKIDQIELVAITPTVTVDQREEKGMSTLQLGPERILVRTIDAFDWATFLTKLFPGTEEKSHLKNKYLELPVIPWFAPFNLYAYIPDDRTVLLLNNKKAMEKLVVRKFDAPPAWEWSKEWEKMDRGLITFAVDNRDGRWLAERGTEGTWRVVAAPLVDYPQFACISFDWNLNTNRVVVHGRAICKKKCKSNRLS